MKLMRLIDAIRNFEITASGGFAIYIVLCVLYVTIAGLYQMSQLILRWFK